ncbi:MAG TPA: VWA domain-containing protein [Vicinamibacterales bacterium]|nr:VWA domain-containing protein [Vicinamibacterales bacterium]
MILALTSAGSASKPAAFAASNVDQEQPQFSTRVTQVEVYATVTDKDGRPVKGLQAEDFAVLEDDVRQDVTTFIGGDFPASVALAIDRSFSMQGAPLTVARTAGRVFVASLKPEDRVMLISISGKVEVLAPLSRDREPLLQALSSLDAWSSTSLNDALIKSLDLLEDETGRRAIVVLSDGADRYSQAREADVLDRARRSDVMVYPIAIGRSRPTLFAELAALTGGRSFHLRDPKNLQSTLQTIAVDLGAQYLLGYAPATPPRSGEEDWRSISVRVNRPGVTVRARSGYSTR